MKSLLTSLTFACALQAASGAGFSDPMDGGRVTAFFYESSPTSIVGFGTSITIFGGDPDFSITLAKGYHGLRNVSFSIASPVSRPAAPAWWRLWLGAPAGTDLEVGFYPDATRYPFHESSPGLYFSNTGAGINTLTGFFEVLEIEVDADGLITAFAADFTQYDGGEADRWTTGGIRYNSTVPIPESSAFLLTALALAGGCTRRRR